MPHIPQLCEHSLHGPAGRQVTEVCRVPTVQREQRMRRRILLRPEDRAHLGGRGQTNLVPSETRVSHFSFLGCGQQQLPQKSVPFPTVTLISNPLWPGVASLLLRRSSYLRLFDLYPQNIWEYRRGSGRGIPGALWLERVTLTRATVENSVSGGKSRSVTWWPPCGIGTWQGVWRRCPWGGRARAHG